MANTSQIQINSSSNHGNNAALTTAIERYEGVAKKLNFDNIQSPNKRPAVISEENTPEHSKNRTTTEKSQVSGVKADSIFLSPSFKSKLYVPVRTNKE